MRIVAFITETASYKVRRDVGRVLYQERMGVQSR
jgi:hypothetical protein